MGQTSIGWPYGRLIETEYPEVEDVVYMRAYPTLSIKRGGFYTFENMLYADNGFFRLFDFPFVAGNPKTALEEPKSIVLSDKLARKLFGEEEQAVNQTLLLGENSLPCTVKGVASVPRRSHIQFDALLSFDTLRVLDPKWFETEMAGGWLDLNVVNYVLLKEGADAGAFKSKIRDLPHKYAGSYLESMGSPYKLDLEPFNDIYLRSDYGNMLGPKSNISYVYLLVFIGLFLLLIACVNFINLSTARSMERAKEVGLRKVVGSSRGALVRQFLTESLLTGIMAMILAIGLALAFLPFFNELTLKTFSARDLLIPQMAWILFALVIGVGLLSGIYPALSLSSFRPVESIKGRLLKGRHGTLFRKVLVMFQFALSGTLIIGTFIILNQIRYMHEQNLGFNPDQLIVLDAGRAPFHEMSGRVDIFKQELAAHPAVRFVSSTGAVPGLSGWRGQISFPEGWAENKSISLEYIPVDYDFVKTFELNIIAGRDFDPSLSTDEETAVIINEEAALMAGWNSPQASIGKGFSSPGSGKPKGRVIGVIENFHQHGLQEKIGPMMFGIRPANRYFALRYKAGDTSSVTAHIKKTWDHFFKGYPHNYFFQDERFAREYEQDKRLMNIFFIFTILTICIASLGLFGLSAFSLQQRTKEIGVRKVLGASTANIAVYLSHDFLKLVMISFLASIPISYFSMQSWLKNYAYRTEIGIDIFIIGAVLMIAVAVLTISYQTIKAALTDPIHSLRYE
ncbi:MAG: ABC transporter permease [Candidatus Aminicenantes bacterium]|nr:ABC transporter permease [Candidatus Aminicenantes bacterium]